MFFGDGEGGGGRGEERGGKDTTTAGGGEQGKNDRDSKLSINLCESFSIPTAHGKARSQFLPDTKRRNRKDRVIARIFLFSFLFKQCYGAGGGKGILLRNPHFVFFQNIVEKASRTLL